MPVIYLEHGAGQSYCLRPGSRVLTADLRWVPIETLTIGQHLVAFEESRSGPRSWRQWEQATVLGIELLRRPCYRLTMADGSVIEASAEHKWLRRNNDRMAWLTTDQIQPASRYPSRSTKLVKPFDVWDEDMSWGGGYLAAAFDGEGSFTQTRRDGRQNRMMLTFTQKDNAMLGTVLRLLAERMFRFTVAHPRDDGVTNVAILGGTREALRFLGSVRPRRLLKNMRPLSNGQMRGTAVEVIESEFIGEQEVVGVRTSTGTLIAEGFATHNSGDPRSATSGSYAGGDGLDDVILFLCPHETVAARWRARYPSTPAVVVGSSRLDFWHEWMQHSRLSPARTERRDVLAALSAMASLRRSSGGLDHAGPPYSGPVLGEGFRSHVERVLALHGLQGERLRVLSNQTEVVARSSSGVDGDAWRTGSADPRSHLPQRGELFGGTNVSSSSMLQPSTPGIRDDRREHSPIPQHAHGGEHSQDPLRARTPIRFDEHLDRQGWSTPLSGVPSGEQSSVVRAPIVAVTFHWPNSLCPESQWALPHYRSHLHDLRTAVESAGGELIGHGHPRAWRQLRREWVRHGIRPVEHLDDVFDQADVLVADNTSAAVEFASLGRPIVWLSAPWYRRQVDHGSRFWQWTEGMPHVEQPEDLVPTVLAVLADRGAAWAAGHARMVASAYSACDGHAAQRAADAIMEATSTWATRTQRG